MTLAGPYNCCWLKGNQESVQLLLEIEYFSLSIEHRRKGQGMIKHRNDSIIWLNIYSIILSIRKWCKVFLFKCIYRLNERACSKIRCLTDSLWRTPKSCLRSSLQKVFLHEFLIVRFQQQLRLKRARGILDTRPYLSLIKAIYIFNVTFIFIVWPLLFLR